MLGYPVSVEASSSNVNLESPPLASRVEYTFPSREDLPDLAMPEVKLVWHDGGLLPARPEELTDGEVMGEAGGGCLFIGTKGKIISAIYGNDYKLLPTDKDFPEPKETLERIKDDPLGGGRHEMDWIRACKESPENRKEASACFDYSGPLSEMVLMGNLAIRLQQLNRKLMWDGENMIITNIGPGDRLRFRTSAESPNDTETEQPATRAEWLEFSAQDLAGEWIRHTYREGWSMGSEISI
jgi:hypothetical protein